MPTASPNLIALARSQVVLLTQVLGAGSSAMYIAEDGGADDSKRQPNLIEIVAYPDHENYGFNPFLLLPSAQDFAAKDFLERSAPNLDERGIIKPGRIVVPLIYHDTIMGFLMTGRDDRDWTDQEQIQIQQVANTLAIACALDRRCLWLEDQLQENVRNSYVQQQDFIAMLFHQLRNPLTALRTFTQLLLRRLLPEDPNRQVVSSILREAGNIQELLVEANQLIPTPKQFNQLESQFTYPILPPALEIVPTELQSILEPLIISSRAIASERDLQFITDIPALMPLVLANGSALREIFNNLIDNAIKYTPTFGKIRLSVQVGLECLSLSVSDTGIGIPETDLAHLFERNFRGRQAYGNISGTGLGLAIAHDLIKKMQGDIQVSSKVNQGSTFTVNLRIVGVVDLLNE